VNKPSVICDYSRLVCSWLPCPPASSLRHCLACAVYEGYGADINALVGLQAGCVPWFSQTRCGQACMHAAAQPLGDQ
jgi:hypothetical protein